MNLNEIIRPTLILNKTICYRNIENMIRKTEASNAGFRPHFKTHQSKEIGKWFRDLGVDKITVSSVLMAEYFISDGWNDIVIAFPFNPREIRNLLNFPGKARLGILASSYQSCEYLAEQINFPLDVYVEIDTGYPRSGFHYKNTEEIIKAVQLLCINENLVVKGILSHFGNSYSADITGIPGLWEDSITKLQFIKQSLACFGNFIVSAGDTPCCSVVNNFSGVDEIRPGNFVFYDVMQSSKGICSTSDIAVSVFCPVIDIHPERNEFIIYGGAIHLSKEFVTNENGERNYGLICPVHENGWGLPVEGVFVKNLSQEHGIVHGTTDFIRSLKIGGLVAVLPVHSCITAQCYENYLTTDGELLDHM